jgi:transposase
VTDTGCERLFLPAYAPDLNPIEQLWAALKRLLKSILPTADNPTLAIVNICQCYC